ncbi:MAG: phosphoribosylanthranilate isomerase [Planctomycetota bacterium]
MAELPRIKVCGLTRAGDVRAALEAGADALGFVQYAPSPRDLSNESAASLMADVPAGVARVLVVVDCTPESASAALAATGADHLQLCGDQRAADWADFCAPILRRIAVQEGAAEELRSWQDVVLGFVLDHPSGPGGSGRCVDGSLAASLASLAPCLLAGGLDQDNVAQRVAQARPAGVDGSSRLESSPGIKDQDRVRAFVAAARAALDASAARQESGR